MEKNLLTPDVLKAIKSKDLKWFGIAYRADQHSIGNGEMSLTLNPNLYGQETEVRVTCPIKLRVTNRSKNQYHEGYTQPVIDNDRITRIYFGESVYYRMPSQINSFLKHIKKDSDVMFEAVIFNHSEYWDAAGMYGHSLYGYIGDDKYLLFSEVLPKNSSTAVNYI